MQASPAIKNDKAKGSSPEVCPNSGSGRYIIEAILFFTYAAFGMTWASGGAFLKNLMEELSLTISQAGFINSSVSIAKFLGPALAGYVSAKLGLRRAYLIASGMICFGIFAPLAPNYLLLLLSRFIMGIGGSFAVVYFTPLVMQWFPQKERVAVNGLNHVSISVGMMVGLFATQPVMKYFNGSWKMTLIIYSLCSVLMFFLWLLFGKDCRTPDTETPAENQKKWSYMEVLQDRNTWKLSFAYSGFLCLYMVLITYFPVFYHKTGFSADSWGANAPSIVMFTGIPVTFLGILLSKSAGLRLPFLRIAGAVMIPASVLLYAIPDTAYIITGAILTGMGMFFWRPSFFTIPQELPGSTPEKVSLMMSVFWASSYIAATAHVWITGRITEITGSFIPGFILTTIISGSMLIGSYIIPETGPKSKQID